jgi:hypothetical protein
MAESKRIPPWLRNTLSGDSFKWSPGSKVSRMGLPPPPPKRDPAAFATENPLHNAFHVPAATLSSSVSETFSVAPEAQPDPPERTTSQLRAATMAALRGDSFTSSVEVEREHGKRLSCFLSGEDMSKYYGHGVYVYFAYLQWSALVMVLLAGLGSISFALNWRFLRDKFTLASAFIALYSPEPVVYRSWFGTIVASVFVSLFATAAFRAYRIALSRRWRGSERIEETSGQATDEISDAAVKLMTNRERTFRRAVSLVIFVAMVGLQAGITYVLHVSLARSDAASLGFVVAAALSVLNLMEKMVSKYLTTMEGHRTITTVRAWDCGKAFALKISNVLIVYLVQALTLEARKNAQAAEAAAHGQGTGASAQLSSSGILMLSCMSNEQLSSAQTAYYAFLGNVSRASGERCPPGSDFLTDAVAGTMQGCWSSPSATPPALAAGYTASLGATCACPLLSMGWTFFFMAITDIVFTTVVDAAINHVFLLYYRANSAKLGMSDEDMKPEFDTAELYVQAWNRTFLILLGAPIFPMIAVLGVFGFLVQIVYDRWKLVRSKRQHLLEEPLSLRLTIACAIIVSLAAVGTYPNGQALILARTGFGMDSCEFYRGTLR